MLAHLVHLEAVPIPLPACSKTASLKPTCMGKALWAELRGNYLYWQLGCPGQRFEPQGTGRIILSRFASGPVYDEAQNIRCPTLILHGDEDPIFSPEHGEDMAARIPDAQLSVCLGPVTIIPFPSNPS